MLKQISIDEARTYVSTAEQGEDKDLVMFDNFKGVDFTDKVLQLGFMLVCFCNSGSASFRLNGKDYTLEPGNMLVGFGEQIFEQCKATPDFSGRTALVSPEYFMESAVGLQPMWPYLLYMFKHPIIHLNEDETQWLLHTSNAIMARLKDKAHRFRREAIVSLMRVFYFDVCNILAKRAPRGADAPTHAYSVFDQFFILAEHNFREHRDVKWYSEQMCLTPKYLSEVVKQVSGKTAGQWLTTITLTEIRYLLRDTSLSIKEITLRLNFPNQSFLGKYFKNATGMSPSEYRQACSA